VVGSFATSDNTCPHCLYGYQSSCVHREFINRAQAPVLRVPLANGTLVATPTAPSKDLLPSLLTTSDVLGTGWFAADAANVRRGSTVAVVGDGAVGLLGVLSAKQMGAERIIAMSRHDKRQKLAREFGATDIVAERGDEGVARIMDLTKGIGADSVLECVGTQESMMQAIRSARPGGYVSYVGVPHGVQLSGQDRSVTYDCDDKRRSGAARRVLLLLAFMIMEGHDAQADQIRGLVTIGMQRVFEEVRPEFETASGRTLDAQFASTPDMRESAGASRYCEGGKAKNKVSSPWRLSRPNTCERRGGYRGSAIHGAQLLQRRRCGRVASQRIPDCH
jgi:NADPH:quinone reductase-like Zn-dependent oxidoreductase